MAVKIHYVESLGQYLDRIAEIGREQGKGCGDVQQPDVLWFRGISHAGYALIPSLLRTNTVVERGDYKGDYSQLHYVEDIRTQHYIAKNYHFFNNVPQSRIEWLEVMQHHGVKTRMLDWSESSIHSLVFAIEGFLDNQRFKKEDRKKSVPCVWVLNSQKLNKCIFEAISEDTELIKKLIEELDLESDEKNILIGKIKEFHQKEFDSETVGTKHIDYIVNLSAINNDILRERSRLKKLLMRGSILNIRYYLLARIYSDGHILNKRKLPPLAVVHPYHSERIKAQKGVFTIFPFYDEQSIDSHLRNLGVNPDAMENNPLAKECLQKIILHKPQKIAYEVLVNGINDSWLYPEMPIVSNEIENHRVY